MGWTIDAGKTNLNLYGTADLLYSNAGEWFVVDFCETPEANNLKESTRTNHLGKNYITTRATSTNFVRKINNPKLNQAEMIKAEIEKKTKSR